MATEDQLAIISAALRRGVIDDAGVYRWAARADRGEDISQLATCVGGIYEPPLRRVAASAGRPWATPYSDAPLHGGDDLQAAAATVPGSTLYASNPLLTEMRALKPALVAAAMAEDPNPPMLFEDADLPPVTASGLDPAVLTGQPWPLRHYLAAAPTMAAVYELTQKYADDPDMARVDLAHAALNAAYVSAFSRWLAGTGDRAENGQPQARASVGDGDWTDDQLYEQLFGPA
jgi:hypothetical protein